MTEKTTGQPLKTTNLAPALAPDIVHGIDGHPIVRNPIRSTEPNPPTDYGLALIRRLSSAPSLYDPNMSALDKQSISKVEKKD